ncbi:hypothetical protein [Psychroflexus salis]|uniref:hypothetical protein n=1 Tax=Psychroflexus salis TaxID=1526574 RepID=UPI0016634DEF|nr:hypothetical protein [Psychroflexus salis]
MQANFLKPTQELPFGRFGWLTKLGFPASGFFTTIGAITKLTNFNPASVSKACRVF